MTTEAVVLTQAEQTAGERFAPSRPLPDFVSFLAEQNINPRRTRVLELGCNSGRNTRYLEANGFAKIVAVDKNAEALEKARQSSLVAEFQEVDLRDGLPYENETFDVIVDCNTSVALPKEERERLIEEAKRILTPGGHYIFYGVSCEAGIDGEPGDEPNSFISRNGDSHYLKAYSQTEVMSAYQDFKFRKFTLYNGQKNGEAYPMIAAFFQKPDERKMSSIGFETEQDAREAKSGIDKEIELACKGIMANVASFIEPLKKDLPLRFPVYWEELSDKDKFFIIDYYPELNILRERLSTSLKDDNQAAREALCEIRFDRKPENPSYWLTLGKKVINKALELRQTPKNGKVHL